MTSPLPLRPPLRLAPPRDLAVAVALLALLVAASALMLRLGRPLETPVSPQGIVDFELAGSEARAAEILAAWDEGARDAARLQTRVDDFVFVPVYVLALAACAGAVAARVRWRWLALLGGALAWAMFAAGALDLVENRQLLAQLDSGADAGRAALARATASVKFAVVYATLSYVLAGAAVALAHSRSRRRG